ncbi:MAG: DUF1592 domain-containing protein [Verrucomicrobiae bacterium]|nr:DUF1592 domain-containing protein [Verrucomicrobiae bacterium]
MFRVQVMIVCLWLGGMNLATAAARQADRHKPATSSQANTPGPNYLTEVRPLLERFCYECHGVRKRAELDLRAFADEPSTEGHRELFEKVLNNLRTHEMPPENKPQPTLAERELIMTWINHRFFQFDCTNPDPGRVTIRRLNRAEYNNTIRDLVGVNFQPAADFPEDDTGYGFDNIGDALSLSTVLLEKYLSAAEKILEAAIVTDDSTHGPVQRFEAEKLESTAPGGLFDDTALMMGREGEVFTTAPFAKAGEYVLRARAFGQRAGDEPPRMEFRLDNEPLVVFDVNALERSPEVYELRLRLPAGEKHFAAAYINNFVNRNDPNPDNRDRNLIVDYLEIVGPIEPQPLPESHRRIFVCKPGNDPEACARQIITNFARRAFRRPVSSEETDRLMRLYRALEAEDGSFEATIGLTLQAVLVSPHFLFRGELQPEPGNPQHIHPIDEYALASRLSYFLWSSMPDDELFRHAERRTLRRNLEAQVKRMLKDARATALTENFAGQWLQLRNLALVAPDAKQFPDFNDELRRAMQRETELFFTAVLQNDRSLFELLDADYTFVNEPLARLYGLKGIEGEAFQRVSLKGTGRGGLLTQAGILTITSNPTRTSPVKRGKWVLDNILGTPPPPPPPDVPELEEDNETALTGTLRQRMEQHRDNPNCASCHARMDPIGFGFEHFNAIGAWREQDGGHAIDASGKLVSGESFNGAAEFKHILLKQKRDDFVRCLTEKMLTYALGRGLEYYDKCAVDQITKNLSRHRYRLSGLVLEIARSAPFQMRRGEEERMAHAEE